MSEPNQPPIKNEEVWTDLVNNLNIFTSAAINLVESLQEALEISKSETCETIDDNFLCACAILSESIVAFASKIPQSMLKPTKKSKTIIDDDSRHVRKAKTPKSKTLMKNAPEAFTKEKAEKLAALKLNLSVTQKNMVELQQQVAQLEKMYQEEKNSVNDPCNTWLKN